MGKRRGRRSSGGGGGSQARAQHKMEEEDHKLATDTLDEFMDNRHKILLEKQAAADGASGSEEEEEEEILGLDLGSDLDSEEEEEEEDELQDYSDLKPTNEDDDEENVDDLAWGKNKKRYYNRDVQEDDWDPEMAEEELEQAIAQQRRQKQSLLMEDFGVDELEQEEESSDEEGAENGEEAASEEEGMKLFSTSRTTAKKAGSKKDTKEEEEPEKDGEDDSQKNKKKKKKSKKPSDAEQLKALNDDLDEISLGEDELDGENVEKVKRDISSLSTEEKLNIIANQSPELLGFVDDFKKNIDGVSQHILPLLQRVQAGELPTSKGVSLLEVQLHLMLSYCIHIAYYMLLKAKGESVKDHPVIFQLVKLRTYLEKIKPIEKKLKYQIDKLLKTATIGNIQHDTENTKDPLNMKPNLRNLVSPFGNGNEASDNDGEPEDETKEKAAPEKGASNGVYRPPMIAPAHYEEEGESKREEKRKKRMAKSRIFKDMLIEFGDRPEEVSHADPGREVDEEDIRRRNFEEDNFVRLMESKKDKQARKRKRQQMLRGGLDDFGDYLDDVHALDEDHEGGGRKNPSIAHAINRVSQSRKKTKNVYSADSDMPYRDKGQLPPLRFGDGSSDKRRGGRGGRRGGRGGGRGSGGPPKRRLGKMGRMKTK
ncbi:Neuroguidin [Balamuthia mandrillaris]